MALSSTEWHTLAWSKGRDQRFARESLRDLIWNAVTSVLICPYLMWLQRTFVEGGWHVGERERRKDYCHHFSITLIPLKEKWPFLQYLVRSAPLSLLGWTKKLASYFSIPNFWTITTIWKRLSGYRSKCNCADPWIIGRFSHSIDHFEQYGPKWCWKMFSNHMNKHLIRLLVGKSQYCQDDSLHKIILQIQCNSTPVFNVCVYVNIKKNGSIVQMEE